MNKKILAAFCTICVCFTTFISCSNTDNSVDNTSVNNDNSSTTSSNDSNTESNITPVFTDFYVVNDIVKANKKPSTASTVYFGTISATQIDGDGDWKDVTYYLFESNDDAEKAFKLVKDNMLVKDSFTESDVWVKGKDSTAVDIVINKFYYKTKNMIICRTDFMGDPGLPYVEESETSLEQSEARHKEIMEAW